MRRRDLLKTWLAAPVVSSAIAQQVSDRTKGLPPLTIQDVKVITTSCGRNYRWVFLKVITSEPGLYGIGSANDNYQTAAMIAALEKNLKPWLIGKDPDRIEDLWYSANYRTYWPTGPIADSSTTYIAKSASAISVGPDTVPPGRSILSL